MSTRGGAQALVAAAGQDAGQFDVAVEVGAGGVHAVIGQDVVAPLGARAARGPDPDQRKVRRAAADVGHQHDLLLGAVLLEVERGGDRLVLKVHLGKADRACGRFEGGLRPGVARGVVVDEEHRPAEHGLRDRCAQVRLGMPLQLLQVAGQHLAVADRMAGADIGALVEQGRAEDALHRAHQAALDTLDIGRQRGAPIQASGGLVRRQAFDDVEHRGRHGRVAGFDFQQAHRSARQAWCWHGDTGVGGAEVDGAVHGRSAFAGRAV